MSQNKYIDKGFSVSKELSLDKNVYKYTGTDFDVKSEIQKDKSGVIQPK